MDKREFLISPALLDMVDSLGTASPTCTKSGLASWASSLRRPVLTGLCIAVPGTRPSMLGVLGPQPDQFKWCLDDNTVPYPRISVMLSRVSSVASRCCDGDSPGSEHSFFIVRNEGFVRVIRSQVLPHGISHSGHATRGQYLLIFLDSPPGRVNVQNVQFLDLLDTVHPSQYPWP